MSKTLDIILMEFVKAIVQKLFFNLNATTPPTIITKEVPFKNTLKSSR